MQTPDPDQIRLDDEGLRSSRVLVSVSNSANVFANNLANPIHGRVAKGACGSYRTPNQRTKTVFYANRNYCTVIVALQVRVSVGFPECLCASMAFAAATTVGVFTHEISVQKDVPTNHLCTVR